MFSTEQLTTLTETYRDLTRQSAELFIEGAGRIASLNLDAIEEVVNTSGEQFKQTCFQTIRTLPSEGFSPQLINDNLQRGADLNLALIEIANRFQQEFAEAVESQIRALSERTLDAVERCESLAGGVVTAVPKTVQGVERKVRKAA